MFPERLKFLRTQHGISQAELAKVLCVSTQTISNYEMGKREPGISEITQLADYFKVSIDYLLGRNKHEYHNDTKTVWYSLIDRIELPASFNEHDIESVIYQIAKGRKYKWSTNKSLL